MEQLQQGLALVHYQQHEAGKVTCGGRSVREWFPTSTDALHKMEVRRCPAVQAAGHSITPRVISDQTPLAANHRLPYTIGAYRTACNCVYDSIVEDCDRRQDHSLAESGVEIQVCFAAVEAVTTYKSPATSVPPLMCIRMAPPRCLS